MSGDTGTFEKPRFTATRTSWRERARFAERDVVPPRTKLEGEDEFFKRALEVHLPPELLVPTPPQIAVPPAKPKESTRTRVFRGIRKAVGWTFIGTGYALNFLFWVPFAVSQAVVPGGAIAFASANPVVAGALLMPGLGVGLVALGYMIRDGHVNFIKAFKAAATDVGKAGSAAWNYGRRLLGFDGKGKKQTAPVTQTA